MKVAINIEFTDDEILRHAETVLSRLALSAAREGARQFGGVANAAVAAAVAQAISAAFAPPGRPAEAVPVPPEAWAGYPPPPSPSSEEAPDGADAGATPP